MSYLVPDARSPGEIARRMVPGGTILLAILFMALPIPLAWGVMPNFALLFVIIWASIQPRLLPTWAAFGLGLLADMLFGGPIGIWAFLFSLCTVLVRLAEAHIERHSLLIDWVFTALILLIIHLLCWQLMNFTGWNAPLAPLVVQAGLTIIAYPIAAVIAGRVQRRLVDVQV